MAWDGKLGGRKGFTSQGEHAFRVFSEGERAAVSRDSATQRFDFYGHRFPLLGRHTYGDGFGAGRGHQGVDVFADCGTRIVAARGGRVQTNAYHSSAGYYVVIDGRGTGRDYVYMHMKKAQRPPRGLVGEDGGDDRDRVRHRQRQRLPPALRALDQARLVRGRQREAGHPPAEALGPLELSVGDARDQRRNPCDR